MLRKYASLENVQVLDTFGAKTKIRHASLGKLADFEQYRTHDGYLYARIRAISSRVNKNHDGWPSIELAGGQDIFDRHLSSDGFTITADEKRDYGFSTFLGKPIFVDHHNSNPDRARGVIVDAKFHVDDHKTSSLDPYYSSKDVDPEHLPGTWVELLLEIDAKSFPKFAKAIVEGGRNPQKGIDGWSMGCDVEKSICSICKNAASSPDEYCNHIKMKGAFFDFIQPDGTKTSKKAYENCYGIKFFEISGVFDPADYTALSQQITSKTANDLEDELNDFHNGVLDTQARYQEHMPEGQDIPGLAQAYMAGDQEAGVLLQRITGMDPNQFIEQARRMMEPIEGWGNEDDSYYSKTQEETITQDPKEKGLKDLADEQANDYLEDTERKKQQRKKLDKKGDTYPVGALECPNCAGDPGLDCPMCHGAGYLQAPNPAGEGYRTPGRLGPQDFEVAYDDPQYATLGPRHLGYGTMPILSDIAEWRQGLPPNIQHQVDLMVNHEGPQATLAFLQENFPKPAPQDFNTQYFAKSSNVHLAENPLPQSELLHAPEKIDTLREEEICPVCGSSMDEDTCEVCGYQAPPEGFDNPDLSKAQGLDTPDNPTAPDISSPPNDLNEPGEIPPPANTPNNPALVAHVTNDMDWDVHTSARINKIEHPLVSTNQPQTNEPQEKILADQTKPVTSKVRTAEDFIAVATNKENNHMNNPKVADSAPPSNEPRNKGHHPMDDARNPEKVVDVLGVGGVIDATNEEASKANGQVDVTGIGSTGVDAVSASESDGGAEGVNVEQGTEHSKNIEAIPTKTWSGEGPGNGDSLGQRDPTTSDTPWWQDNGSGWRGSSWSIEGHDDAPFPDDEISGGSAVQGNQPIAESFGERVDVLDHVTSPANNSGPTKTWTGTDGNGVNKQQDPVTNDSIARGESGMEGAPNWTSSTHIFAAFKLADTEIDLGLTPPEQRYERAAELERETPQVLEASLKYAQRVKQAASKRVAGAQKLPVMGRSDLEKEASTSGPIIPEPNSDDSFMFGA